MAVTYDPTNWYKVGQSQTQTQQPQREHKTSLGKDDFLKLLITQMRYQDPLKPMEDREYIAQLAQFSSLEQMMNVGLNSSLNYGMSALGKQVSAVDMDGYPVYGTAVSVRVADGEAMMTLKTPRGYLVEVALAKVTQVDMPVAPIEPTPEPETPDEQGPDEIPTEPEIPAETPTETPAETPSDTEEPTNEGE